MPDITLTVDFTQVNSLNTTLKSTDTIFVKVVDSLLRESKRADRVTKAFADTTQKNLDIINKAEAIVTAKLQQESDRREKLRVKETARAEKEAQKLVDANNRIAKAEAKRSLDALKNKVETAFSLGKQKADEEARAIEQLNLTKQQAVQETERLRLKYDKIYASSQLYERSLEELNTAHRLGIKIAGGHEAAVESLNQEYQNFQNGIRQVGNRFVQHSNQTSDGMSRMGVAAQQTGYQVSDFIVQVQGGTNPLVAFSQQMTQMAGLLYLLPPALQATTIPLLGFKIALSTAFAGVAILIPLLASLAMAFFNSGDEAESGAKSVDKYKEALNNLKTAIKSTQSEIDKLSFGTEDPVMAAALKAFREAEANLEVARANQRRIGNTIAPTSEQAAALREAVIAYTDMARLIRDLEEKQNALSEAQRMLNGGLSTAAAIQKGIIRDKEVELRLAEDLKTVNKLVSEGLADPQKKLLIQQYYQGLLEKGVKPAQATAVAQQQAERYLLQSVIASGQLNNEQLLVAKAALQIFEATVLIEEKIKASEKITKLLEQGLSLSVIEAMKLAGVDFTKLSDAALAAGVLATNLGISFGLASEIGKISAMSESDRKIYTGVKSGLLPEAALNSIGLGPTGFTREGSFPINMPGMMPDNPTTASTGTQGGSGPAEATQTAIEKLQEQLAVERELIGTSEAYQKVRQTLGEEFKTTSPEVIAGLVEQATQVERLIDLEKQREQVLGTVKSSMEDTLMSIVDGTKSARDAFKAMAADIIKELYRVYVVQQLVNSVSGFFAPSGGSSVSPPGRAAGGSMMANMAYMVGENGPELVIPRHSGTVVNAKQTASAVGGGGSITVQNNITVTGSDAAMVRTEVAKMIPQITNATKAAVLDAKQRGGQFAAAFR